jgi:hypothetical protein
MSKIRPLSITILAWVFIIAGAYSIWDVVSGLWQHRLPLNFGVLFVFLGRGLLRLRPAALSWALALTVLGWICLAVAFICLLCGLGDVRFGHEIVTGARRLFIVIGGAVIYGAFLTWVTRVVTRRDIVDLFHDHVA